MIIFSAATIMAEPFEQEIPLGLYQAIAQNGTSFQVVNLLAALGIVLLTSAFALLARLLPQTHRRLTMAGLTLLALATLLWLIEITVRLIVTTETAHQVGSGPSVPTTFPANAGVGFEPLFVAFLATSLAGLAVLLWQFGQAGLLSKRWSSLGAGVTIASGSIAAITYPWVGGVERALFYPFVLVLLPLANFLFSGRASKRIDSL